ncbi:hypothetical protein FA95DRAFT_1610498 [Auriscalpium vulgare]|uniref:Uncharacterized protein n=1 Tax=Auriscalpium vulgare TaxID=40419 RepID=A0ACB8REL1_9AGAM|nr:hypothetical protein FA95DRAFT_1610498 [Auriscalpium vulgare]
MQGREGGTFPSGSVASPVAWLGNSAPLRLLFIRRMPLQNSRYISLSDNILIIVKPAIISAMPIDPSTFPVSSKFAPNLGAYAFFTIDPLATPKTYVGYVSQYFGLPTPDRRYYKCTISLLSRGLPEADEEEGIEETMCVAVGSAQHPEGRAPITPNPPLPWDDVYHHVHGTVILRVANCEGVDSLSQLSHTAIAETMITLHDDGCRSIDLIKAPSDAESQPTGRGTETPPPEESRFHCSVPPTPTHADATPTTYSPPTEPGLPTTALYLSPLRQVTISADYEGEFPFRDVMMMMARSLLIEIEDPKDRLVPVAQCSTKWDTTKEFTDAKHIYEEFRVIDSGIGGASARQEAASAGAV